MSEFSLRKTTVFVIGAGFSYDLGYPLTRDLLHRLKMSQAVKATFDEVVKFHHPNWDGRTETLPDIEELLTEWVANEDLLPSLRRDGNFTAGDLKKLRADLLYEIASWFTTNEKEGRMTTNIAITLPVQQRCMS